MSDVGNVVIGGLLIIGGAALTITGWGGPLGVIMMNAGAALLQAGVYGLTEERESLTSNVTGQQIDLPVIYGTEVQVGHANADVFTWGDTGDLLYMVGVLGVTSDNGGEGIGGIKQVYNQSENAPIAVDLTLDSWGTDETGETDGVLTEFSVLVQALINAGFVPVPSYSYHAHSGADTDNAVDGMLAYTRPSAWPSTSKGEGLSYIVHEHMYNEENYSAFPKYTYIVDGNKIPDFRTSGPIVYDSYTNPAIVLYDYLTSKRYGLGLDEADLDVSGTFTSAANWCDLTTELGAAQYGKLLGSGGYLEAQGTDTTVIYGNGFFYPDVKAIFNALEEGDFIKITSGPNAGNEYEVTDFVPTTLQGIAITVTPAVASIDLLMSFELYRGNSSNPYEVPNAAISGAVLTSSSHKDNIDKILDAMRGKIYWQDGQIKLWVRKPETAQSFVLDADTNVGDIEIVRAGVQEVYNSVSARYVDPAQEYEIEEIVWPRASETNLYLAEDNGVPSQLEIEYPLIQNAHVAWRFAEIALKESRQDVTVRLTATEDALQFTIGDVVKLKDDTVGWTAKEFWLIDMTLDSESKIQLVLKEYDSSVYTSLGQMTESGVPGGRLPSPLYMAAPTNLTLLSDDTTVIAVDDTGDTYLQQIKVNWLPSTSTNLYKEEVYYKQDTESIWTFGGFRYAHERDTTTPYEQTLLVGPAAPVTDHNVKVEAVSRLGVRSTALTGDITTASVPGFGGGTGSCPNLMGTDAIYRQGGETAGAGTIVQYTFDDVALGPSGLLAGDPISFCANVWVRNEAELNPTNVNSNGTMGRRKEGLIYSLGHEASSGVDVASSWRFVMNRGGWLVKKGQYALEFDQDVTEGRSMLALNHYGQGHVSGPFNAKLYVQAYMNYEGVSSPLLGEHSVDPDSINLLLDAPAGRIYKGVAYNEQYYMSQPLIGFVKDLGYNWTHNGDVRGFMAFHQSLYAGLFNGWPGCYLYQMDDTYGGNVLKDSANVQAARIDHMNEPVKMFVSNSDVGISGSPECYYYPNPQAAPIYTSSDYWDDHGDYYWWLALGIDNDTGLKAAGIAGYYGLNTDVGKVWWSEVKLFHDHVTRITGLTPGDYVKLVEEDEETNDGRYAMSITAADANGEVDMWWNWHEDWRTQLYGIDVDAPNFSCRAALSGRFEVWDGPPWEDTSTRTFALYDDGYAFNPGDIHEKGTGLTAGEELDDIEAVVVMEFIDSSGGVIGSVESTPYSNTTPLVRQGVANTEIPGGTAAVRLRLEKRGSATGTAWVNLVQLNGGANCCSWSVPAYVYLPPAPAIYVPNTGDDQQTIIGDPESDDPNVQLAIDEHREGGGNLLSESRDERTIGAGAGAIDGDDYTRVTLADHGIEVGDVISIRGQAKTT